MQLLRIEFSNFRQYKKLTIFFPQKGLIGVIGNNGAGKSTLFNTLAYAFYGKYDDVNKDMLRNQNSSPKDHCYVIVDFLFQGRFYRVKRDLVSTRCYVEVNGARKATTTGSVTDFIENDLFKMDHKAFTACYYATQDGFDALTKLNPRPREEMLLKLLRIDSIDKAAEKTRKDKRVLEIEVEESKRHLKNETELTERKNSLEEEEKSLTEQFNTLKKNFDAKKKEFEKLRQLEKKGNETYKTYQLLLSEVDKAKSKIITLTENSLKDAEYQLQRLLKQKERYEEIKPEKDKYYQLIQEREELNGKREEYLAIDRLEKELQSIQNEIGVYEKSIKEKQEEISSFDIFEQQSLKLEKDIELQEQKVQEARDKYQEYQTQLALKKQKYNDIVETKKQFEDLGEETPCPTCKRPLGEHYGQEMNHLEQEMKTIISESKEIKSEQDSFVEQGKLLKNQLDQMKVSLKANQNKLKEKSSLEGTLNSLKTELNKKKTNLEKVTSQRSQLPEESSFNLEQYKQVNDSINSLTSVYEEILGIEKTIKEIPSVENRISKIKEEIESTKLEGKGAKERLDELEFNEEEHKLVAQQVEELREELEEMKEQGSSIQTQLTVCRNNITTVKKDIEETQKILLETKEKQVMIANLTKLDEFYKSYKQDNLRKLAPTLSDMMSDMIDSLTDSKYNRVELDEQYNVFIYREGIKNPLEFYSGGERKLAALCQRLAISQLLVSQTGQANFDMTALDEVFGAMDNQRQDSMIEMFRNLTEMFSQILIVAHNDYVKDMFDHTLLIELGNDKNSTAKWLVDDNGLPTWDEEEVKAIIAEYELQTTDEENEDEEDEAEAELEEV